VNGFVPHAIAQTMSKINSNYLSKTIGSLQSLKNRFEISQYRLWSGKELGVGYTPLREIPKDMNPYAKNNIHIFYKPEYLNRGGSGKGRSASFMLSHYKKLGLLEKVNKITTAGFGNFIRSLAELLQIVNPNIVSEAYMGNILVDENRDLVNHLKNQGVIINGCEDNRCPTGDMDRGKAIAYAYLREVMDPSHTIFLDQHGVFKPYDGLLNAAGYYHSLAQEILYQIPETSNLFYVNGEGTRGSLVGVATRIKEERPKADIVGLRQEEDGHLFGLRSKSQLGKSETLGNVEELCNNIYEIPDETAYSTMNKLWELNIPATPSGGSYVAGALRKAEELKKKDMEGTIVTLIFDSIEYYKNILDIWMPKILGKKFDYDTFETLRSYAFKDRSEHIKELRLGQNRLLRRMVESEAHARFSA
jgi:cysteine synthase